MVQKYDSILKNFTRFMGQLKIIASLARYTMLHNHPPNKQKQKT